MVPLSALAGATGSSTNVMAVRGRGELFPKGRWEGRSTQKRVGCRQPGKPRRCLQQVNVACTPLCQLSGKRLGHWMREVVSGPMA